MRGGALEPHPGVEQKGFASQVALYSFETMLSLLNMRVKGIIINTCDMIGKSNSQQCLRSKASESSVSS